MRPRAFLRAKYPQKRRQNSVRGQAAVEYILLVGVCLLIFGAMFYAIRQSLFRLWICDITPRVQAATGCDFGDRRCYVESAEADAGAQICSQVAP